MKVIADLEVHSKYARAVSSQMILPIIDEWAAKKGINLVGTGDFTHPLWFRELKEGLDEETEGIYRSKNLTSETRFLLTSEISCIYSHKGKTRRVHIMVYLPSFSDVEKFNRELSLRGANLFSDGRPIVGLTLAQILEIALGVNPKTIVIPAHVWTPWFGFYGFMSGYDSLKEAFGDLEKHIPAIETGLSSDPAMNWKISELENKRIVSFGDAHSPQKLGREATVFELSKLTYNTVRAAMWDRDGEKIAYTIEFYPEEGRYHFTGHRNCKIVYSPNEARKMGMICPVCGKNLTLGVMSRVESLAAQEVEIKTEVDTYGVRWIKDSKEGNPPYVMVVPLLEIVAEALGVGTTSQKALSVYKHLVDSVGSEFRVLLETETELLERLTDHRIVEGIKKVRGGDILIEPGYDGIFGKLKIWKDEIKSTEAILANQSTLF